MVVVFHDPDVQAASENATRENFVDYGRRLTQMIQEIKAEPPQKPAA
jgi:hypothetical protein